MLQAGRTIRASHAAAEEGAASRGRVLLVRETADDALTATLSAAGFESRAARGSVEAARLVAEFDPHVVIIAAGGGGASRDAVGESGDEFLEFARRLRSDKATRALPLVILCRRGDEGPRAAALELGADDCFAPSTPREVLARLDALLWRVEAGRGVAAAREEAAALARRDEIDDFIQLLEAARAAADSGENFSLALVAPALDLSGEDDQADAVVADSRAPHGGGDSQMSLAKVAHEFLSQNLRRADSVAFYGPTLLVALLPRRRPGDARRDLARLSAEFAEARPGSRLASGLASFPGDGADAESLIEWADAELASALKSADGETRGDAPDESHEVFSDESSRPDEFLVRFRLDADGAASSAQSSTTRRRGPEQEFLPLAADEWRSRAKAGDETAEHSQQQSKRGLPADFTSKRAVRESKRGDEFEAAVMPYAAAGADGAGGVLGRAAAEAAARERARRASGEPMPRRVLLTVSDPARMAQINLLLRSAAYEVRAAFDGGQALDLLRIERADLLVLDYGLKVLDGLGVLRGLSERHRGRLPLPIVLLLPADADCKRLREEAAALGANGFVSLPYDPAELLDRVRTIYGADRTGRTGKANAAADEETSGGD